jgi:hypothetical protein
VRLSLALSEANAPSTCGNSGGRILRTSRLPAVVMLSTTRRRSSSLLARVISPAFTSTLVDHHQRAEITVVQAIGLEIVLQLVKQIAAHQQKQASEHDLLQRKLRNVLANARYPRVHVREALMHLLHFIRG